MNISVSPRRMYRLIPLILLLCVTFNGAQSVAASPTSYKLLDLPAMGQVWNLSCEYAATSAATAFYGSMITQQSFLDAIGYNNNPHMGFRGRITGPWGGTRDYGVYAEPIATALHSFGFTRSYFFYGGVDTLKDEIAANHPVVVWITGTYRSSSRFIVQDGDETYSLIPNEHAVTVYGYDDVGVWVMDPSTATKYRVGWGVFLNAWNQFDGMGLVVA